MEEVLVDTTEKLEIKVQETVKLKEEVKQQVVKVQEVTTELKEVKQEKVMMQVERHQIEKQYHS